MGVLNSHTSWLKIFLSWNCDHCINQLHYQGSHSLIFIIFAGLTHSTQILKSMNNNHISSIWKLIILCLENWCNENFLNYFGEDSKIKFVSLFHKIKLFRQHMKLFRNEYYRINRNIHPWKNVLHEHFPQGPSELPGVKAKSCQKISFH